MYQLVVGIQLVSILVLLVETWVVFKNWKSSLHSWLFLGCVSTLVNSCGYLYELLARSEDVYFTALRLSYLGRVWTVFCLSMFVSELVQKAIPRIIKIILALFCVATTLVVNTTRYTGLYYRNIRFYMNGYFPVFSFTNGIWHHLYFAQMLVLILVTFYFLIKALWREKNPISQKRLLFVLISILAETLLLLVEMFKLLPITRVYDVTMLSFPVSALFMLIAIFKYQLMDTERIARDYMNDELSEGVIAVNEFGDVGYFNRAAISLFPDLPLRPAKTIERLKNAIQTGEPITINDRIYTPKDSTLLHNGEDVGTLYALVDNTEHFHYMEELEKQKAIADRANKAKSSFLANMSHEIRTPINAVLGMDEMILRESREKNTLAYAEDIETAGRTLLSLINDILDFSKIEEGRMEILPTQYEMFSVINDLVNMIRDRADKKGLKLKIHVDKNIPHLLYGDEIRIKQVVLNLLTNAVKYTEKGEVGLEVSFFFIGADEIRLQFKISDTGIGMKEEDMEKLFSPFARIEEERNRFIEGTGLGMSIVKQLLALMDSHLDVHSVYGEGSTFSFAIKQRVIDSRPVGDVVGRFKERTGDRKAYRELFHAPDARILVVDDTEVNLEVIKNLLKKTQIRIDTASSGKDALDLARTTDYDVALIDHMMPDMNGIETLERMKEEKPGAGTVYIALTANAVSGAREMYLKAGFFDYLSKPVDGRSLEEMFMRILPEEKLLPLEPVNTDNPIDKDNDHTDDSLCDTETTESPEQVIPAWLNDIPALDVSRGIENCGSEESFLNVLTVFHQTAVQKAEEIRHFFTTGDIENYTVKVHALKSSARIIGAASLSEAARELEAAGKSGDMDMINDKTNDLLDAYLGLDEKLSALNPSDADLKELSPNAREDAFRTITEIAGSMDYGLMDEMLKDLKGYRLSQTDTDTIKKMEAQLMELNWDGILESARAAL